MNTINGLLDCNRYLFLLAHPDDDVYCDILIGRLIKSGKKVCLIFATSGDAGSGFNYREKETLSVMKRLGVGKNSIHFLSIPELKLLNNLHRVISLSLKIAKDFKPNCIIGQDYEGGHEGHDVVSFCASEVVRLSRTNNYFVFPIYHGKPQERKGARFKPQRKTYLKLKLTKEEKELKKDILNSYLSQKNHFDGLRKSSSDYSRLLFSREVYFKVIKKIDFGKRPMKEIGYEYHRNGTKFKDFQRVLKNYNNDRV